MKHQYFLAIFVAFAFAAPVFQANDAEAGVFSTVKKSRKKGKRTHKLKKSKKKKSTKSGTTTVTSRKGAKRTGRTRAATNTSRSTTQNSQRRTTTTRVSNSGKTTRRTTRKTTRRVQGHSGRRVQRTRTTRRVYHGHSNVHHRHVHNCQHHSHYRTTYVSGHNHGHSHNSGRVSARSGGGGGSTGPSLDAYITGGLGLSGLASEQITDGALPGMGYDIAIGAKGKLLGVELGLNGGNYTFDPDASDAGELAIIGGSLDVKLQPSINIFEPYAFLGLGGYHLADSVVQETAGGAALRAGFGADVRFDSFAIGAKYTYSGFAFGNEGAYEEGVTANAETISAALKFYF